MHTDTDTLKAAAEVTLDMMRNPRRIGDTSYLSGIRAGVMISAVSAAHYALAALIRCLENSTDG
jgi:hypothetical protein